MSRTTQLSKERPTKRHGRAVCEKNSLASAKTGTIARQTAPDSEDYDDFGVHPSFDEGTAESTLAFHLGERRLGRAGD